MPNSNPASGPNKMRSYAVVGLGAIGGYYGARLAAAGHVVHFLVRSDAESVRRGGLVVDSPFGDIHLDPVSVFTGPEDVPPVDVVVLAVKTTDTEAALSLIPAMLDESTVLLVLQNGLGIEAPIAAFLSGTTVLGGLCFICSNRIAPGHIRHLDYGAVTIGEHSDAPDGAGITPAVAGVAADFERAGLPSAAIPNLVTGRWRKLVWNIGFNGLSVVLDAGTDELMGDTATRRLVEQLMAEVGAAAAACGHYIEDEFVREMLATTDKMTPYDTSMKIDFNAGRPLEIEAIYGAPIAAARAAGYEMVLTTALHEQLRFIDSRNRRGRK